jgi:hypothetical protein
MVDKFLGGSDAFNWFTIAQMRALKIYSRSQEKYLIVH